MKRLSLLIVFIGSCLSFAYALASGQERISFDGLLEEAGLVFQQPDGFHELEIEEHRLLPYEKRLLSDDGDLELRYAIRPLGRIVIDYEDPHNAAPSPNDMFEMLFRSISEGLAVDSHTLSRAYLPLDAQKEFNAGWASISVFDVDGTTSKDFTQAMLIAIHQNDRADAYTLILTNDLSAQKSRIKAIRAKLRFAEFNKDINR